MTPSTFDMTSHFKQSEDKISVFSIFDTIPESIQINLPKVAPETFISTNDPRKADFLAFPVFYEVAYEYSDAEKSNLHIDEHLAKVLLNYCSELQALAQQTNKQIIVFYYRDPSYALPVKNAIVFRTSLLSSQRASNEFALPAFSEDFMPKVQDKMNPWLAKQEQPHIGFRGQAAPFQLPLTLQIKKSANQLLAALGTTKKFNLHYNYGYMARRDAMIACMRNKKIETSFLNTTHLAKGGSQYKSDFVESLYSNPYSLCVSGHGNYSYRLYETMSLGRIPVFVNTDCVLPFQEHVDWKKYVIWVPESDANKTDQILLDFHHQIHPDDFLTLQKNIRQFYVQYLTGKGFYSHLNLYLQGAR